jgi:hypothetical protein
MNKRVFLWLIPLLAVSGCMSLTETAGRIVDGSKFAEKTLETYSGENGINLFRIRFRDGTAALKLTFESRPNLAFYLSPAGETSRYILSSCTFLASTLKGWNEFTMDLSGTGSFEVPGNDFERKAEGKERYRLVLENIEEIGISSGRIRAGENRLSGDEARRLLQNRKERIEALVGWMKDHVSAAASTTTGASALSGASAGFFQNEKEFAAYWKPILLPEMTPKRKRPADYSGERNDIEWTRAEDVRWNTAYSAKHFPEDVAVLRNSGALLRDWEEALPWIYLSFQWEDIINSITGELYFVSR